MAPPPGASRIRLSTGLALLLLLGLTHLYFANELRAFPNPNVQSRVYLTLAIVDSGTFNIDEQVRRYGPSMDMAEANGRLYSDKAPGYSAALVPFAWLFRAAGVPQDDYRSMAILLRIFGLTLPAIAFWMLCWRDWSHLAGSERFAAAVVLAGATGTNFYIYSTQLFAHAMAGMLLYLAWRSERRAAGGRQAALCGFLLAAAFTVDYIAAPAVIVLAIYAVMNSPRGWAARAMTIAAGAAPVAAGWILYNIICFGHPFDTGFRHHADPLYGAAYRAGLWGIQAPDPAAIPGMTVLPARGLFWTSPVLVLALAGWWLMRRDPALRRAAIASAVVSIVTVAFAMTTVDWRGGWSVSTRYLVPVIPLLLMAVSIAVSRSPAARVLFAPLAAIGVVQIGLAASTFPGYPNAFSNPPYDLALPLLGRGALNGTLWNSDPMWLELVPYAALILASVTTIAMWTTDAPYRTLKLAVGVVVLVAAISVQALVWRQLSLPQTLTMADVLTRMGLTCDADRLRIDAQQAARRRGDGFNPVHLALTRATTPCDELRSGSEAMVLAQAAIHASGGRHAGAWDALGAALAESGEIDEAIRAGELALSLAGPGDDVAGIQRRLRAYSEGRPYRSPFRPR